MMPVFSESTLIFGFAGALAVFCVLGIFFPLYDFVQARRHARKNRLPLPDRSFLAQEFRYNPLLGSLFFLCGIILIFCALSPLMFSPLHALSEYLLFVAGLFTGGGVLAWYGQKMLKFPLRKRK